jgi:hypothetical protein
MKKMIDPKYFALVADLLKMAGDEYANRSCNDYDLAKILSNVEDRRQLLKEMNDWNGSPEDYDSEDEYVCVMDSWLMSYFGDKFQNYSNIEYQANPHHRCYQELLAAYTILCSLLKSMHEPVAVAPDIQKIADDILAIRECLTRAEYNIPNI